VSTGSAHACGLVSGTVRCWGYGYYGALGTGTLTSTDSPTTVAGLTGVSAISLGADDSCALVRARVFCWGDNSADEVGNGGTSGVVLTPAAVGKLGATTELSTGGYHVLVKISGGGLRAWGYNFYGALGDGTNTSSPLPVHVLG
jgi:alpha-tubulin suppressor-like RCC1 family protein